MTSSSSSPPELASDVLRLCLGCPSLTAAGGAGAEGRAAGPAGSLAGRLRFAGAVWTAACFAWAAASAA